jgi:hypothetical protein
MRLAVLVGLAVLAAAAANAGERRGRRGPDLDVVVPLVPEEHERVWFFDGRDHHAVPGTVTINADPYVCDRDGARFDDRDVFLFHLRSAHEVEPGRVPGLLQRRRGRLHFVGD